MCRGLSFSTVGRVILFSLTLVTSLHSEWHRGVTSRVHFRWNHTLTTFTGHSWHVTHHLLLFASNFACMYVHVFVFYVRVMHNFIVAFIHSFYIGTWQDFIQIDVVPKGSGGVLQRCKQLGNAAWISLELRHNPKLPLTQAWRESSLFLVHKRQTVI